MGTPDFAVESLKKLYENNFEIVGVITSPDTPAGRGQLIQYSAVKQYALDKNLNILQPSNLKDEVFIEQLKSLNADLQIVVAFRMLPTVVWNMPKFGTFNLHASLLPQYRGAAPINWAIINGEEKTGLTTFFLDEKIDTGNIIFQEEIEIKFTDNAEILHDKLMYSGGELVLKTVNSIIENNYSKIPQNQLINNNLNLKSAPKIFKENCLINWNSDALKIYNFIRGLSTYPAAWTEINDLKTEKILSMKIFETEIVTEKHSKIAGEFETDNKNYLKIYTADNSLLIKSLQLSGKKRLDIKDFLKGYSFENKKFVIN